MTIRTALTRTAPLIGLLLPALASAAPAPQADLGFLVTVRPDADAEAVARDHGVRPEFVYGELLHGFAGDIAEAARAGLLRDGRVVRIERDAIATTSETAASWGLDRIDQRARTLDGKYGYGQTGRGVTAYVVDTGILPTHAQFEGRASVGYDALRGDGIDCNGHGTHVAGIVGGLDYGVAKDVTLKGVRVLDCGGSGKISGIVAGLDWVARDASGPSVVNLSLATGASATLDDAVQALADRDIPSAVAAANYGKDACLYSPARAPSAITVGATDPTDARSTFSNWGECVDLFAPGASILSAAISSDTASTKKSGTSMAAPHVAGVAALFLEANPGADTATTTAAILDSATHGIVTTALSSQNHLLYSYVDGGAGEPPPSTNAEPYADFTFSCSGRTCTFTDRSYDDDGRIASRAWSFGDGAASTARKATHTYATEGTWAVRLQVTDDEGATDLVEEAVTVSGGAKGPR